MLHYAHLLLLLGLVFRTAVASDCSQCGFTLSDDGTTITTNTNIVAVCIGSAACPSSVSAATTGVSLYVEDGKEVALGDSGYFVRSSAAGILYVTHGASTSPTSTQLMSCQDTRCFVGTAIPNGVTSYAPGIHIVGALASGTVDHMWTIMSTTILTDPSDPALQTKLHYVSLNSNNPVVGWMVLFPDGTYYVWTASAFIAGPIDSNIVLQNIGSANIISGKTIVLANANFAAGYKGTVEIPILGETGQINIHTYTSPSVPGSYVFRDVSTKKLDLDASVCYLTATYPGLVPAATAGTYFNIPLGCPKSIGTTSLGVAQYTESTCTTAAATATVTVTLGSFNAVDLTVVECFDTT